MFLFVLFARSFSIGYGFLIRISRLFFGIFFVSGFWNHFFLRYLLNVLFFGFFGIFFVRFIAGTFFRLLNILSIFIFFKGLQWFFGFRIFISFFLTVIFLLTGLLWFFGFVIFFFLTVIIFITGRLRFFRFGIFFDSFFFFRFWIFFDSFCNSGFRF